MISTVTKNFLQFIFFIALSCSLTIDCFAKESDKNTSEDSSTNNEWIVVFPETPSKFLNYSGGHIVPVEPKIIIAYGSESDVRARFPDAIDISPNHSVHRQQFAQSSLSGQLRVSDLAGTPGDTIAILSGNLQPAQNLPTSILKVMPSGAADSLIKHFPAPLGTFGSFGPNPEFVAAEIWDSPGSLQGIPDIAALRVSDEPDSTRSARLGIDLVNQNLDGTFATARNINLPNSVARYKLNGLSIRQADLNGDGKTDLVTNSFILWGSRGGEFTTQEYESSPYRDGVVLTDLNRDGKIDIVQIATSADSADSVAISVAFNQGNQQFKKQILALPANWLSGNITVHDGDVNGDGLRDLIILDHTRLKIGILTANQTGSFSAFDSLRPAQGQLSAIVVLDFNNDGIDDIGASVSDASVPGGRFSIFYSLGTGFQEGSQIPFSFVPSPQALSVTDVNGDGSKDILIGSESRALFVLLNSSSSPGGTQQVQFLNPFGFAKAFDLNPRGIKTFDSHAIIETTVFLKSNGRIIRTVESDASGRFNFGSIPPGSYEIVVSKKVGDTELLSIPYQVAVNGPLQINVPIDRFFVNGVSTPSLPSRPAFSEQWGLLDLGQTGGKAKIDINILNAWKFSLGSKDTVIGVLDGAFDSTHPSLSPNSWRNSADIPGNGIDDDNNGYVDDTFGFAVRTGNNGTLIPDEHATHVAGIIGAGGESSDGTLGVVPTSTLIPLDIFGGEETTSQGAAIKALTYALKAKKSGKTNIKVINASIGETGQCSEAYRQTFNALNDAGILVVVAAGNESANNDVTPSSPANCDVDNIISVAAIGRGGKLTSFSNYGKTTVDIAAPGEDILSTGLLGKWVKLSGTSQAAPFVSGVAGLISSLKPNLSPSEVKNIILQTGSRLKSISAQSLVFNGVVNAGDAALVTINSKEGSYQNQGIERIDISPRMIGKKGGRIKIMLVGTGEKKLRSGRVIFMSGKKKLATLSLRKKKGKILTGSITLKGPFAKRVIITNISIEGLKKKSLTLRGPSISVRS